MPFKSSKQLVNNESCGIKFRTALRLEKDEFLSYLSLDLSLGKLKAGIFSRNTDAVKEINSHL